MNKFDIDEIIKFLEFLGHREAGGVTEVRIFPDDRYLVINNKREYVGRTVSGYYNDYHKLAKDIAPFDGKGNIYVTINPCNPELLARAANRLRLAVDTTTSDADILCDLWFPYDTDPVRPAKISATNAELELALKRRDEIADFFAQFGVTVIKGMSGNGGHGLIKLIGYPNNAETREAKKKLLHFLARKFSDDKVSVDDTVFNMARIWKLYGTLACKGDNIPERPHRCSFLEIPDTPPAPVALYGMLDKIIDEPAQDGISAETSFPTTAQAQEGEETEERDQLDGGEESAPRLNVESYLKAKGVEFRVKQKGAVTWFQFYDCPIHKDTDGDHFECGICQYADGKMGATCMHNPKLDWQAFKAVLGDPKPHYVGGNKQKRTSKYLRGRTFIPKRLADDLLKDYKFIYAGEFLYVYQDGVYQPEAEHLIEKECQRRLGQESRRERINEVIYYIEVETRRKPEELNTQPSLINLENGLYDWIEEKLLPHDPDYLSTIRIPVKYDPSTTCQTIDYFFDSTLQADCIPIAEELFGYALIPDVRFEKSFMLTGGGANGKSTFLTLLETFVGSENVSKIPLQELDENRFKRAELFGKLVNLFADLDQRALQSSTYFKTVVSGDMIDAERKHKDPFFFRPFTRLAFSANQLPQSPDRSFAYYRRWIIIPFPHQFVGDKADKSLPYKLTQPNELSGLLNRALKGLNRLFEQESFTESATVQAELDDYKRQNDTVAAFVADWCVFDPNAKVERTALYDVYTQYCESEGFKNVESRIACYNQVRALPQVIENKDEKGNRYFAGVQIKKN